jgi:hypothetical protein
MLTTTLCHYYAFYLPFALCLPFYTVLLQCVMSERVSERTKNIISTDACVPRTVMD